MMQRQQTISEFLSSQSVIRVYFDSMPYGTGNQASSYQLMHRLRELGFKGKYEVVYIGTGYNKHYPDGNPTKNIFLNKEKIINLFDLPADLPDVYYDKKTDIEFIESRVYYTMNKAHHSLAITGGQLEFCRDTVANDLNLIKSNDVMHSIQCNDANIHEVDLYLSNEAWVGKNPAKRANVRLSAYDKTEIQSFNEADHLFNNPPKSLSLNEIVNFLKDPIQSSHLNKQRDGLLALIDGASENKFHVMPFYGRPLTLAYDNENHVKIPNYCIYKMLNYIVGVKLAQLNGPKELRDKPILLPVFVDYRSEAKILKQAIQYICRNDGNIINEVVKDLKLDKTESLRMLDISFKDIRKSLSTLSPNSIVLISVGKLPNNLFNAIYPHIATLPPVLEGENTKNLLISETNKPFLRLIPWFFSPGSTGPKEYYPNDKLLKRYQEYDDTNFLSVEGFVHSAKWISEFIIDSLNPQSDICQYFNWLHEEAIKPKNDRVVYALNKAITYLTENMKISLVTETLSSSTNIINKKLNQAYDGMLSKMVSYASTVVTQCPSYFDSGNLNNPYKHGMNRSPLFFVANNTCYPCISNPTVPKISM